MTKEKWTALVADEQPLHEEIARAWMAIVIPADDNKGLVRVYGPTKEKVDARATAIALALSE